MGDIRPPVEVGRNRSRRRDGWTGEGNGPTVGTVEESQGNRTQRRGTIQVGLGESDPVVRVGVGERVVNGVETEG